MILIDIQGLEAQMRRRIRKINLAEARARKENRMQYIVHYYLFGSSIERTFDCGRDSLAASKYALKRKAQGCSGVYVEERKV